MDLGKGYYSENTPEIVELSNLSREADLIENELFYKYDVKRGLRDLNGKGVLTGLTRISEIVAKKVVDESERQGIGYVALYDEDYPELLRNTINEEGKLEPPLLIWYRGDLSITKMPGLAVIGTREPTSEGIAGGQYLASEFAKILTICVSSCFGGVFGINSKY